MIKMKELSPKLLFQNVIPNIERDIANSDIAGASVLVAQRGKLLLSERRGFSDVERREPLKDNSVFRLASMTKPVTAIASLIAVERGWFSLDDPITDYFPRFSELYVGRQEGEEIIPDHKPYKIPKVYNFLTHTSGFMASGALGDLYDSRMPYTSLLSNREAVDYCMNNHCLTLEPISKVSYCAYQAFDLVALLIEKFSGMSYADFLSKEIFEPLGMKDTTYRPTEDIWKRTVTMSNKVEGRIVNVDMGCHTFEQFPLTYTSAGAGLVGTVCDYYTFARMLLGRGTLDGVQILKRETFELMPKAYVPKSVMGEDAITSWGLGVQVYLNDGNRPAGTYGWSGAYGTHFWVDPTNEIIAIYMKNSRWHDSHGAGNTGRQFERDVYSSFMG